MEKLHNQVHLCSQFGKMVGGWVKPLFLLFTCIACFSFFRILDDVGRTSRFTCCSKMVNFPAVFAQADNSNVPEKGLISKSVMMTILMVLITIVPGANGSNTADLFTQLTSTLR